MLNPKKKIMCEIKINLDRPKISSKQIDERRNFEKILLGSQSYQQQWKNPWFWGATGMATLSLPLLLNISNFDSSKNSKNDKTATFLTTNTTGNKIIQS